MEDNKKVVKTTKKIYPQIYSYTLPDFAENDGWQKVGYTERRDVDERIREQTKTAAKQLHYEKLWSASAIFTGSNNFFTDKQLHKFYVKNGIKQSEKQEHGGLGEEWFYFDGTPERSKELFDQYSNHDYSGQRTAKISYELRGEQKRAVFQTLEYAANNQTTDFANPNEKARFLWNAKPRFGKTLTSYDFAKRFNAKNVLIVTNRPAIANSWFDDFEKFVDGYYFVSTTDSLKERSSISRTEFLNRANPSHEDRQITFLSLQDLKGGRIFGGAHDKLEWVASLEWDLLIIDEAHEGVDTERTDKAFDQIKRRFTLHLSGTPFKAIADGHFSSEQIFNWTYIDEQKAKAEEIEKGDDAGAHVNLPDMRLFTYKMSDIISGRLESGMDLDEENIDYAFELNEMFATNASGKFIHEDDIRTFLNQLTTNEKYPFSTPELRDELKHTFWMVGNRVASAKAMEKLLRNHPIFSEYKIIVAAGDGKPNSDDDTSEEEMQNIQANEKAYDRVKKAIRENDKTITLSVGQLTTGVTIEEWSAVLMLSDIKSESLYMQAIFRSQNPYKFVNENGEFCRKKSAYVFDFSPNRVLRVYDKFANSLLANVAQGEATEKQRLENVAELLNYFPVLAEDKTGEMIELDAEQVLTFPKAIIAKEVVNRGFVTNLLFVNINNVFNIPTEVINSLNKTFSTNDTGRVKTDSENIPHDSERKTKKEHRISVNKEKLLGSKVYGTKMQEIVATAAETEDVDDVIEKVLDEYMDQAAEPFAMYREIYSPSNKEFEEKQNEHFEKAREIVEEYVSKDLNNEKNQTELAEKLSDLIQNDLPNDLVTYKEEEAYEKEEKTEMDKIREKLRTFTRAIPSFVMASQDVSKITIDNIEDTVSDEDFEALLTERDGEPFTKDDFRKIRGPWTNPETGETFEGFFDRYTFNAAIREFEEKRQEVADYLRPGIKEDIFSYIRPLKTNQIFTPRRVVNMMLDALEKENPGIFENPDLTFCDPYVKSGLFLTEIAKRLNRGLEDKIPDKIERINHIFEKQLYGFAPTNIIYNIAHKFIYGILSNYSDANLVQRDLTEPFKKGETLGMKFDVVVGNPPYQETTGKTAAQTQGNSNWIYQNFQFMADKISNTSCLIYPFGGWFDAPDRLGGLGDAILGDGHTVSVEAFEGTTDRRAWYRTDKDPAPIFGNNANLSAGVAIVLRDSENHETFKYYNRVYSDITATVNVEDKDSLTPNPAFVKINEKLGRNKLNSRIQKGVFGIESDFVEKNPNLVSQNIDDWENPVHLLTNDKSGSAGRATWFWTDRKNIPKGSEYISKYKVVTTSAYPKKTFVSGMPTVENVKERAKSLVELLPEDSAFGRSRLSIIMSDNKTECDNFIKYSQTTFFAGLMLQEPNRRSSFGYIIPDQDFTSSSDIDWGKSIPEIDQQLYKKYGLDESEIAFIEQKVAPME